MMVLVFCGFCTDLTTGMARRGVDLGGKQVSGCSERGRAMYVSIAGLSRPLINPWSLMCVDGSKRIRIRCKG